MVSPSVNSIAYSLARSLGLATPALPISDEKMPMGLRLVVGVMLAWWWHLKTTCFNQP